MRSIAYNQSICILISSQVASTSCLQINLPFLAHSNIQSTSSIMIHKLAGVEALQCSRFSYSGGKHQEVACCGFVGLEDQAVWQCNSQGTALGTE